jgi:hypothetical protein
MEVILCYARQDNANVMAAEYVSQILSHTNATDAEKIFYLVVNASTLMGCDTVQIV